MDLKSTLRAITLELRRELEGTYNAQGTWQPGDLERRLAGIGVRRDRLPIPVDELPHLTPHDWDARRVADVFLESRAEAGQGREAAIAEFVRDAAYSWANRLLALRCMEARGLIDEVILQKDAYGGRSLQHHRLARKEPERCVGEDEGVFAVLFDEFARRAEELPLLFDPKAAEVALRPSVAALKRCIALLSGTLAAKGQEATDAVFTAPDALGWAYQYWNTEEKHRVFAKVRTKKGAKIEGAEIIPATCIYTEPYMVKFLVQNSLGATWMGMRPDSRLFQAWEYYVRDADRAPVAKNAVSEITFLDPACGSGHFLLEAFELFYAMYLEDGAITDPTQICAAILERNLYGIDIDERAVQIAALALVMKAREKAPAFVPRQVNLVATNIRLPAGKEHLEAFLRKHPEDLPLKPALLTIFEGLAHADQLGSLLQIEEPLEKELRHLRDQQRERERKATAGTLFGLHQDNDWTTWKREVLARLRQHFRAETDAADLAAAFFGEAASKGLTLVDLLARRYDVVAANPPYMGSKNMGPVLKRHVERHFVAGKRDLYAAFILRCLQLTQDGGRVGMVTQQSWMFQNEYQLVRAASGTPHKETGGVLRDATVELVAHLGPRAFTEIAGEVVSVALFVVAKLAATAGHRLRALRAVGCRSAEDKRALLRAAVADPKHAAGYAVLQRALLLIPGTPLLYWVRPAMLDLFVSCPVSVENAADVIAGLSTGDNPRFVRAWWEVSRPGRWVPYEKGGGYRKWWGLHHWQVDWQDQGARLKAFPGSAIRAEQRYFTSGLTYTGMAQGSLGLRVLCGDGIFAVNSSSGVFPRSGVAASSLAAHLSTCLSSYLLRCILPKPQISEDYLKRMPLPALDDPEIGGLAEYCILAKRWLTVRDLLERDYDLAASQSAHLMKDFRTWYEELEDAEQRVAAVLHTLEAQIETRVVRGARLDHTSIGDIIGETGTPAGWHPVLAGHDALPGLPDGLPVPKASLVALEREPRLSLIAEELSRLTHRLRSLYEAGPRAKVSEEEPGGPAGDDESDEQVVAGARIPIPAETFLEELSQKLEIHPISIYWLLRELREGHGIVCGPEFRRFVEDWVNALVLRLLGHRWPREVEAVEAPPTWADRDGIVPITEGTDEPTLLVRVQERFAEAFGAERVHAIEREFQEIVGKSLEEWLVAHFFTRHISQFKKRPIAWQIQSAPGANGNRQGRRSTRNVPAFSCLVCYHRLDADLLPKLRTQYLGPLRARLQTEMTSLEKIGDRSPDQDARRLELEDKLDELKTFDTRLEQVIAEGFSSAGSDALLANEPLDKWTSRTGRAAAPASRDAFLAQERRYDPDLNDGVRVNIAPLQRAGLLAADVLVDKDVEKAIADRAVWRADERRWCREGKLPQPGWWQVPAEKPHAIPALPDTIPSLVPLEEAAVLIFALVRASGGTIARLDLARAFALRNQPEVLLKLAPASVHDAAQAWAKRVSDRNFLAGLLAKAISELADREGVHLDLDPMSRSLVTATAHTPEEDKLDPWFRFEARLALGVLAGLSPRDVQEVDASISGDDRQFLGAGAA